MKITASLRGSLTALLLLLAPAAFAAETAATLPEIPQGGWQAQWVTDGSAPAFEYGVYHFRCNIMLENVPKNYVIHISADNRYRLFVNGTPVCRGPARGDLDNWYYESADIAPYLHKGKNTLAVQVWNMGEYLPFAQFTRRTALIVQGNTAAEKAVNTPGEWVVMRNEAFSPIPSDHGTHYLGAQDEIDGARYPWGWETTAYDDSAWKAVKTLAPGRMYGESPYGEIDWVLRPRDIPQMEETLQRIPVIRRSSGIPAPAPFTDGSAPLVIPARTKCSLLLDQTHLTTAYPEMLLSGGRGSSVRVTYAEALFNEKGKGNRDEIDGREIRGYHDLFRPDGAANRLYRTLWFKTYRYVQLDIETGDDPLTIHDFYGIYTGYPFAERGSFASDDPSITPVWNVGWRTARLCAHETYFDCPYYEQLQYLGDTRIQALISLYVSGDDRLARKAIRLYDQSRWPEGITASRYPSSVPQIIPPFSLYWVDMVHDYWMHRDDDEFVRSCLPGIKAVLAWYSEKIDPATGMLRSGLPHWNFSDWVPAWVRGVAPEGEQAGSSIVSLQLADALGKAAELTGYYGDTHTAGEYGKLYRSLTENTYKKCWDPQRGLLRDYAGAPTYSQHANIFAILTDAVPAAQQKALFERLDTDTSIAQATFYYRFYLYRALKKVGLADRYVDMLDPWHDMIAMGLTTFSENPEPARSDCHAWSSSPNYDLLATVCGIEPAAPGFRKVRVEPHMGRLNRIRGVMPHPEGDITVELERSGTGVRGTVTLPAGLDGTFCWEGRETALSPGSNTIAR